MNTMSSSINDLKGKKIIIYGAGATGHSVFNLLSKKLVEAEIIAFCDTYKSGMDEESGLEILRADKMLEHKDAIIILGVIDYLKQEEMLEIEVTLKELGFPKKQIFRYSRFISLFEEYRLEEFEWQKYTDNIYNFDANILLIKKMSECIDSSDKSIVDLGAGNMNLKNFISPDAIYYPIDYKQRYPETVVCDFNKDKLPNIRADVYFMCAVLYYADDPIALLEKASIFTNKKIIIGLHSKNLSEHKDIMHVSGFKSYLYVDEIQACLSKHNFSLVKNIVIENIARRYMLFEKMYE